MQRDPEIIQLAASEVDYDLRRRQISRVVARLWAERGERACTIRAVAAELGTSVTVITRAFASRAEMIRFTLDTLIEAWYSDTESALAAESTPGRKLKALLAAQCAMDEESLLDASLWIQTLAPQHRNEDLIRRNTDYNTWLVGTCEPLLEALGSDPAMAPLLLVAVYGLTVATVENPEVWTFDRVDSALDELLLRFGVGDHDAGDPPAG